MNDKLEVKDTDRPSVFFQITKQHEKYSEVTVILQMKVPNSLLKIDKEKNRVEFPFWYIKKQL